MVSENNIESAGDRGDSPSAGHHQPGYTVVARRYRPRQFSELVGQETVIQALTKAIQSNRVGHAYLFTGARGVGKTSAARIFAKALNAPGGPSIEPPTDSDVALAIDAGEDMDVLEIDGASNRGIEEIRHLRMGVNVRPSRSQYKIYIIDEVHMLTTQAFNALLKTLEEPPEHVKFIFCTTDPDKIPITVLSRCQRFDFPPLATQQINERLQAICQTERIEVEPGVLELLARRARGSMRDSQSLLEQLISFSDGRLTVAGVHAVLGTAEEGRLEALSGALERRDACGALTELEASVAAGLDPGHLAEQLLAYLRDVMTAAVGGGPDLLHLVAPSRHDQLQAIAQQWGSHRLLASIQLIDEALVKMRHSLQSRLLLEVALVQVCQLPDLDSLAALLQSLKGAGGAALAALPTVQVSPPGDAKKKVAAAPTAEPAAAKGVPAATSPESAESPAGPQTAATVDMPRPPSSPVDDAAPAGDVSHHPSLIGTPTAAVDERHGTAQPPIATSDQPASFTPTEAWFRAAELLDGVIAAGCRAAVNVQAENDGGWKVVLPGDTPWLQEMLQSAEHRPSIEAALERVVGTAVRFRVVGGGEPTAHPRHAPPPPKIGNAQLIRQAMEEPYIIKLLELFGGHVGRVQLPQVPPAHPSPGPPAPHAEPTTGQSHQPYPPIGNA